VLLAGARIQLALVTFEVEIRRTVNRDAVLIFIKRADRSTTGDTPRVLVSCYLTPRVQQELCERGISYDDAAGNLFLTSS